MYLKCDNFDQNVTTLLPHQQEIYSLQTRITFSNMFLKSFTHSLYYKKIHLSLGLFAQNLRTQ